MINALERFYEQQLEPTKSFMLALKTIILSLDTGIKNELKYGMPFFTYKGKMFCYLWFHKKYQQPYIGLVEGKEFDEPFLLQENRSRMKIYLLDLESDLDLNQIESLVQKAIGTVKAKTDP